MWNNNLYNLSMHVHQLGKLVLYLRPVEHALIQWYNIMLMITQSTRLDSTTSLNVIMNYNALASEPSAFSRLLRLRR